jgi:hypothetical protein
MLLYEPVMHMSLTQSHVVGSIVGEVEDIKASLVIKMFVSVVLLITSLFRGIQDVLVILICSFSCSQLLSISSTTVKQQEQIIDG